MTHLKNLSRLTRAAMMLLVMLLTATTGWADAPSHKIVVIADPHVMGDGLQDGGTAWQNYLAGSRKLIDYSQALFDQAVSVIQTQKPELVLIVGDLTKDGEQASHDYVKRQLNELKTAGIPTLVIPGNHDLGTDEAKIYSGDAPTDATTIGTASAFATLYADYGYGASSERLENTLTYACEPIDGLVVIGIDSGTGGTLSSTTLDWVCEKAAAACAAGKQVIAMMHHPLIPHITGGETFVSNVSVSDYANVRNRLADAGITTIFTGHFHTSDIAKDWNADKTKTIYDITTGSLCSYPCDYRIVTLNNAMTKMSIATETATGDATITADAAKTRLTTVVTNLAKAKILAKLESQGASPYNEMAANMMAPKLASAYIYHAEGNENSNDDAQELLNTLNATFSPYPAYQALVNSMLQDKSNYGDADREDQTNDRTLTGISMPLVVSTWAQLKAACEAGGMVKLTTDVTRDAAEGIIIENTTVTVDLNGYTIRGYADEAQDDYSAEHYSGNSIFYVYTDGSLTITDGSEGGTIANVRGTNAVCIDENGSVTMTGGTICNASGGVSIYDGSFTMTGGTIKENGSGVDIASADATFTVSGNVNITGNEDGDDVCLLPDGQPIHIGDDGLAATARIGVKVNFYMEGGTLKPFTSGLRDKGTRSNFVLNKTDDPDDYYYRDYYYTIVTTDDGELALIRPTKGGSNTTGGIYFYNENRRDKAIIDASSTETLSIPNNKSVRGFTYDRTFNPGKASTVMLPFSYETQGDNGEGVYAEGGAFYSFIGVYQEDGKWVAMMDRQENLQANTPYLFVPDEGSTTMSFPGIDYSSPVWLTTEGGGGQQSIADGWVFQGTYEARHWYDGTDGIHNAENADEIGTVYGFAATSGKATDGETDVEVGQFVQVASGASIKPTRAYLKFTGGANARGAAAAEELPKTISVRLVKKGETMGIPTPDPSRAGGEDGYYTLSGQRLTNGQKPTAKGLYIINGRKEVVK